MKKTLSFLLAVAAACQLRAAEPVDYVRTTVGTMSKYELSTGNTYPAVARPWGMNFWTPQTGKMGNGWTYVYTADKIRGFKQTHQPSPWINDYGQFAVMPVTGGACFDEDARASWFSHKAETATPYYYSVYLADHDVTVELTPTERAAMFRLSYPDAERSYLVIDAFDRGSWVKIMPGGRRIVGYTTRNSGGVPDNFRNWFVVESDTPFEFVAAVADGAIREGVAESQADHAGAVVGFRTERGRPVHLRVASSFIDLEQAERNLGELGDKSFDGRGPRPLERGAGPHRGERSEHRQPAHLLFVSLPLGVVPARPLRDRRCRTPRPLQPLQRYGLRRRDVHRHGFLGHFPFAFPAAQPRLSRDGRAHAAGFGQYLP